MSRNHSSSTTSIRATIARRRVLARAKLGVVTIAALALFAVRAEAQTTPIYRPFELRPFAGAFVPTGEHRDLLEDAVLVGAQASYAFNSNVALVGSFGWSPSKNRTLVSSNKVDLYQYDLGVEGRLDNLTPGSAARTQPYAALGIGGRTYDRRGLKDAKTQTNFLAFGAVGLELAQARGPLGLRLEVRDNITSFKGLDGALTSRKARNDLQFSAGITVRI
jgi:hypothetical protein